MPTLHDFKRFTNSVQEYFDHPIAWLFLEEIDKMVSENTNLFPFFAPTGEGVVLKFLSYYVNHGSPYWFDLIEKDGEKFFCICNTTDEGTHVAPVHMTDKESIRLTILAAADVASKEEAEKLFKRFQLN